MAFSETDIQSRAKESAEDTSHRHTHGHEDFNEGKWSDEEHRKFLMGLSMFGKNWNKIQKYIKTRSCPQTRSHAQKFFRKLQKHGLLQGMSTSSSAIDAPGREVGGNDEFLD